MFPSCCPHYVYSPPGAIELPQTPHCLPLVTLSVVQIVNPQGLPDSYIWLIMTNRRLLIIKPTVIKRRDHSQPPNYRACHPPHPPPSFHDLLNANSNFLIFIKAPDNVVTFSVSSFLSHHQTNYNLIKAYGKAPPPSPSSLYHWGQLK